MIRTSFTIKRVSRGFTMVELLIVLAIVGLLMGVFIEFYVGFNKTFSFFTATYNTAYSASDVIRETSEALLESTGVITSQVFAGTNYTTSSTTLVLQIPSVDSSGNIVSGSLDHMVFYIIGTSIYRRTLADATSARVTASKILSSTVQNLTFTYDNATVNLVEKVDVDVVTQKQLTTRSVVTHLHKQTYLRNK